VKKVAIIDYGMGNLFSVKQACIHENLEPLVTSDARVILDADGVILPGVGAFGEAMMQLQKLDLIDPIHSFIQKGNPFMGICLGFQLLFSKTEEFGHHEGLNIIQGKVVKFPKKTKIKVPHVGWNKIFCPEGSAPWSNSPLQKVDNGENMYFVHSYYVMPDNDADKLAVTEYGDIRYCSAFNKDNIFATQFHPEKSGIKGLGIYNSWATRL
jgi:imidazole glycerol-phosphate synthase subunit HisH